MQLPANKTNPFQQSGQTWLVEFNVPYRAVAQFEQGLETLPLNISSFEDDPQFLHIETAPDTNWKISLYSEEKPDELVLNHRLMILAALCDIPPPVPHIQLLPEHDWVSDVQKSFIPLKLGRYFVHCSSYEDNIPVHCHRLKINASLAFGTGEHETTSGCLLALDRLAKGYRFTNMLDMGCGTGILAIAMAKTWKHPVLAADIDANAVKITQANARMNGVASHIATLQSNGYLAREVNKRGPYDLIVSNILAGPLVKFAKDLRKHLRPGGIAVVSGLLISQENRVLKSHQLQGLTLRYRIRNNGWSVLVLQR